MTSSLGLDTPFQLTDQATIKNRFFKSAMSDITWYEEQMARMGAGRKPDPDLAPLRVVLETLCRPGLAAFRPRRA